MGPPLLVPPEARGQGSRDSSLVIKIATHGVHLDLVRLQQALHLLVEAVTAKTSHRTTQGNSDGGPLLLDEHLVGKLVQVEAEQGHHAAAHRLREEQLLLRGGVRVRGPREAPLVARQSAATTCTSLPTRCSSRRR